MQDHFELIRQQPGFSELALQAWALTEKANSRLKEATAEYEAALKAVNRAEEAVHSCSNNLEKILELGERLAFPREMVEAFCRNESTMARDRSNSESPKKQRLPNFELMILVAEVIAQKNRPVNLDEVLEAIEERGIHLPGSAPQKNMLAYLSHVLRRAARMGGSAAVLG